MILQKYATAVLSLLVVLVTAVTVMPDLSAVSLIQLGILVLGAVATYIVPVVDGPWRGILKTGVAVVAAVLTAIVAGWGGVWTVQTVAVIVLAGVQALAAQLGVAIRNETPTQEPVDPGELTP